LASALLRSSCLVGWVCWFGWRTTVWKVVAGAEVTSCLIDLLSVKLGGGEVLELVGSR
jgi:hypothetical protein